MAVLTDQARRYVARILGGAAAGGMPGYLCDPLLAQVERIGDPDRKGRLSFAVLPPYKRKDADLIMLGYVKAGVVGAAAAAFAAGVVDETIDPQVERKVVAMKEGFPSLPATTCATILRGLGGDVQHEQVLAIYGSYGMSRSTKDLAETADFTGLNRRAHRLQQLIHADSRQERHAVHARYLAMHAYVTAPASRREQAIAQSGLSRSLFFYYWKTFQRYGLLGLVERARETFRRSKIGLGNEAKLVIDRLRRPTEPNSFFTDRLKSQGISTNDSTVIKIFGKWKVKEYRCEFVDNLERLDTSDEGATEEEEQIPEEKPQRWVDTNFLVQLNGLRTSSAPVDAPGLFTLWCYLDELGIFPLLQSLGLTGGGSEKGYSWFDLFLLDVARTFYGIASHSRTCDHEERSIPFFSHLLALPCNDSFLSGLASITEEQICTLRRWLVRRGKQLGVLEGKRVGMDFHQIDREVWIPELRNFGKGPSPKKKLCYNGFRPHIAWDLETGCIVAAEFRKSSARGTSTVKRFTNDYLMPEFKNLFDCVYVDSEYTGKSVWEFILDANGMNAHLTACLKQNPFVKRARDAFLNAHAHRDDFWRYYDDEHVYADGIFPLVWSADTDTHQEDQQAAPEFRLNCVVKKNIKTGSYRCFGSSRSIESPVDVLNDYSHRWKIENGIKDLVRSYFLDQCPGTNPHQVDVHFFIVTVCRLLYRMIERDLGERLCNPDGSVKTLQTMRDVLFRQGPARVQLVEDTIQFHYQDSFSQERTELLEHWFDRLRDRHADGLQMLDGFKLSFHLRVARGEEHRNAFRKARLRSANTTSVSQGDSVAANSTEPDAADPGQDG
jgi:hypothetical protein